MNDIPEERAIYQNHRDNQRERILEAAEKLFIRDGIDHVSVSAIASAARISRKTMYQYFPDKREIAWGVFQKIVEHFGVDIRKWVSLPGRNGYQRLENFMLEVVDQLEAQPEHFRFIVEFDSLYARENNPAFMRQFVEQHGGGSYNQFAQLVREGVRDGSLRADLDPDLVSAAILNLVNGMGSRFALLGAQIRHEYGQPVQEIFKEICRAFLRGIQSKP